eukprot:SAG22_NODE_325_length_12333_cov_263.779222_5_plen_996_part_00
MPRKFGTFTPPGSPEYSAAKPAASDEAAAAATTSSAARRDQPRGAPEEVHTVQRETPTHSDVSPSGDRWVHRPYSHSDTSDSGSGAADETAAAAAEEKTAAAAAAAAAEATSRTAVAAEEEGETAAAAADASDAAAAATGAGAALQGGAHAAKQSVQEVQDADGSPRHRCHHADCVAQANFSHETGYAQEQHLDRHVRRQHGGNFAACHIEPTRGGLPSADATTEHGGGAGIVADEEENDEDGGAARDARHAAAKAKGHKPAAAAAAAAAVAAVAAVAVAAAAAADSLGTADKGLLPDVAELQGQLRAKEAEFEAVEKVPLDHGADTSHLEAIEAEIETLHGKLKRVRKAQDAAAGAAAESESTTTALPAEEEEREEGQQQQQDEEEENHDDNNQSKNVKTAKKLSGAESRAIRDSEHAKAKNEMSSATKLSGSASRAKRDAEHSKAQQAVAAALAARDAAHKAAKAHLHLQVAEVLEPPADSPDSGGEVKTTAAAMSGSESRAIRDAEHAADKANAESLSEDTDAAKTDDSDGEAAAASPAPTSAPSEADRDTAQAEHLAAEREGIKHAVDGVGERIKKALEAREARDLAEFDRKHHIAHIDFGAPFKFDEEGAESESGTTSLPTEEGEEEEEAEHENTDAADDAHNPEAGAGPLGAEDEPLQGTTGADNEAADDAAAGAESDADNADFLQDVDAMLANIKHGQSAQIVKSVNNAEDARLQRDAEHAAARRNRAQQAVAGTLARATAEEQEMAAHDNGVVVPTDDKLPAASTLADSSKAKRATAKPPVHDQAYFHQLRMKHMKEAVEAACVLPGRVAVRGHGGLRPEQHGHGVRLRDPGRPVLPHAGQTGGRGHQGRCQHSHAAVLDRARRPDHTGGLAGGPALALVERGLQGPGAGLPVEGQGVRAAAEAAREPSGEDEASMNNLLRQSGPTAPWPRGSLGPGGARTCGGTGACGCCRPVGRPAGVGCGCVGVAGGRQGRRWRRGRGGGGIRV